MKKQKNKEDIKNDIVSFWSVSKSETKEELGSALKKQLEKLESGEGCDIEIINVEKTNERAHLMDTLRGMDIDLLVTYNLAGFELRTLTDGFSYNLVDCRQLHIIDKCDANVEEILKKDTSINMFFWDRGSGVLN